MKQVISREPITHEANSRENRKKPLGCFQREISKKNRRFVLLDTNFILTCVKQKIDFFHDIKFMGMKIIIPKQVINELTKIVNSKKKLHFRKDAELSLRILEKKENSFKKINLSKYGKNTDKRIKNFADENKNIIVATLDRILKNKIKNRKLVIRGKKQLEVM